MANVSGNFGSPKFMPAGSGIVKAVAGEVIGFLCITSTSGTISLFDANVGTGTAFLPAMPVTAGQFLPIAAAYGTALFATLANCTGTFIVV